MSESSETYRYFRQLPRRTALILLSTLRLFPTSADQITRSALEELDHATNSKEVQAAQDRLAGQSSLSDPALQQYLRDQSIRPRKRYMAFEAVTRNLSDHDKWQKTIDLLRDDSAEELHLAALTDMATTNDPRVHAFLRSTWSDPKSTICERLVAGASLSKSGDAIAKNDSLNAVINNEPCNESGMETLANLHALDAKDQLKKTAATTSDRHLRDRCQLAILHMELEGASKSQKVEILKNAMSISGSYFTQDAAARRLGAIGGESAFNILIHAYVDHDPTATGKAAAESGLKIGIENGFWTSQQIQEELNRNK